MPKFNIERRNFFKLLLLGIGALFVKFSGIEELARASSSVTNDKIGVVYNTATGAVIRTINPGPGEQSHLDWVQKNLPKGTSLLRINKLALAADDHNCPNIDVLMRYVKQSS